MLLKPSLLTLAVASSFVLSGCDLDFNGSKSTPKQQDNNVVEQTTQPETNIPTTTQATRYKLSATVAGLNGTLQLNNGSETQTIASDGTVVFTQDYAESDTYNLSIAEQPENQICTGNDAFTGAVAQADISINIECLNILLTGTVLNSQTGQPVVGATVSNGDNSSVTNEEGVYTFTSISSDDNQRVLLNISSSDSADYAQVTYLNGDSSTTTSNISLQPAGVKTSFDPTQAQTLLLENSPATVILAPNSLVDGTGNLVTGPVNAKLTAINPLTNPELMPGSYETIVDGNIAYIESFGAIDVSFTDEATGERLNLAPGQTATIRIPLSSASATPPSEVPLYYYDVDTGYWVEEGSATLVNDADSEASYYEGSVNHFTVWNADQVYNTVLLHGCVQNTEGTRLSSIPVYSSGGDYIGTASTLTNTQGEFSVAAKSNSSQVLLSAFGNGLTSNTLTTATLNNEITFESCLVVGDAATQIRLSWGEAPRDLDAHLLGPSDDSEYFHLSYSSDTDASFGFHYEQVNNVSFTLDVDDTSSYGPEIMTIPSYPLAGRYYYAVHHYAGTGTITESPTLVNVKLKQQQLIFQPSTSFNSSNQYWLAFEIVVDEEGNIELNKHDEWLDEQTFMALPTDLPAAQ